MSHQPDEIGRENTPSPVFSDEGTRAQEGLAHLLPGCTNTKSNWEVARSPAHGELTVSRVRSGTGAFAACRQGNTTCYSSGPRSSVREREEARAGRAGEGPCEYEMAPTRGPVADTGLEPRRPGSLPGTKKPTGSFSVAQEPWQQRSAGTWSPDQGKRKKH